MRKESIPEGPAVRRLILFWVMTIFAMPAWAGDGGYKLLTMDGATVKWGAPQFGRGALVTWRIDYRRGTLPGRENCKRTQGFDHLLRRTHLTRANAEHAAAQAFAMWSAAADIRFAHAKDGEVADITIAAMRDSDGIAFSDVTPAPPGPGQTRSLSRAVICLSPAQSWAISGEGTYRLFYVLAHEIGHAIGLDHPGPSGAVMSFAYDPARDALSDGDIAGAVMIYGTEIHHGESKTTSALARQFVRGARNVN